MSSSDAAGTRWRGVYGGQVDHLYVGAYVVDQETGTRGQIEALLDDGWVQMRRDDGRSVRARLRPGDPAVAQEKLAVD